jgi:lambda repressor-like predicted transcriptional regulator
MNSTRLNHKKIKALIKDKGLTFASMARHMGLSRQYFHYMITSGGPRYASLIANQLGCNVDDILLPEIIRVRLPEGFGLGVHENTVKRK